MMVCRVAMTTHAPNIKYSFFFFFVETINIIVLYNNNDYINKKKKKYIEHFAIIQRRLFINFFANLPVYTLALGHIIHVYLCTRSELNNMNTGHGVRTYLL